MKRNVGIGIACVAVVVAVVAAFVGLSGAGAEPEASEAASSSSAAATSASAHATPADSETPSEADPTETESDTGDDSQQYEQGAILVSLQDGTTAAELNARLADLDYIATKQVSEDDAALGYVKLELADGIDVKDTEARIADENSDIIAAAQPNYIYHLLDDTPASATTTPTIQTALVSGVIAQATTINDTYRNNQWALAAVKAYDAWDIAQTNGSVTVAVIDNGCLTTHEDLKGNIVATYNAIEGVEDDTDVTPVDGHGTHVCGIIAAETNNSKGVAGVSFNAKLLPIQVFEGKDASSLSLYRAYAYVLKNADTYNIRVANMSLGGAVESDSLNDVELDRDDRALMTAVSNAHNAGILTTCAAGNDADKVGGAYLNFPSDWLGDCALNVIATTSASKRASFSNYNMTGQTAKQISAPGFDIYSSYSTSTSKYAYLSGTSMAAPCVAGIAALVFAADPDLTAEQAATILCNTAQDLGTTGWDRATGFGLVDANAAVTAAKEVADSGTSDALTAKTPILDATVTLSTTTYTYNGSAKKPTPTVKVGITTLTKNTDYTVAYSSNTNAGTGKVTITGKGAYTGTLTKTFTIKAKPITPTITLGATAYTWNNAVKTPGVTVKFKSGSSYVTLKKNTDYTVTYASGRKNVGRYSVKITAKGNYSFTAKTLYFKINPKTTSLSKLTTSGKTITAKWAKQATKMSTARITGYQVQVATNTAFTKNKVTKGVSGYSKTSCTIPKLKAKTKYYVRIRTYKKVSSSVTLYSPWSTRKAITTKA